MMNEELLKEMYDDMLDECYPMVNIAGYAYYPSTALRRIDLIAYKVGMNDFESALREDYENGLGYEEIFGDEEE